MTYQITKNDYFDRQQPSKSEEIYNSVTVITQPLGVSDENTELYRSETLSIPALSSITIDCEYNSFPVQSALASVEDESAGISISSAEYYAWGAIVTVENAGVSAGTCLVVVDGTALSVIGEETIKTTDTDSINENGLQTYEYPTNHLIQTREEAILIGSSLLSSYKDFRKDCSLQWRGDPTVELGDIVEVPEYQRDAINKIGTFYVVKNNLKFNGTVTETTECRKVAEIIP